MLFKQTMQCYFTFDYSVQFLYLKNTVRPTVHDKLVSCVSLHFIFIWQ